MVCSAVPIVGLICRQTSEKFVDNRRKSLAMLVIMVYNMNNMIGCEVLQMKNYRKRIADDILKQAVSEQGYKVTEIM